MKAVKTRHLTPADLAGRRWRGLIRESTQAQADRWSPERQRQDIERTARELGMVGDGHWYDRVGSGEQRSAPEVMEALADGRRGEYDVLVLFSTSRLARDRVEAGVVKRSFAAAGVIIYFVAERLISGTYAGALSEGLHEVLDEHANEERRLYVSGGMQQRQLAGQWVGNVPYGMRKVMVDGMRKVMVDRPDGSRGWDGKLEPDGSRGWDGSIEPDPETGPIVRSIFDAFATGRGTRSIAMDLNSRGIRSTTGAPWRANSIDRILSNPVYVGRLIRYGRRRDHHYYDHDSDNGHVDVGERFPALVDPVLFDQVARLRASRTRPRGRLGRRAYPLSGTLRCQRCGNTMTGVTARGHRYYRCTGRRSLGICTAPSIRADKAEAAFASWLGSHRLPPDWRDAIARTNVREARAGERDRQTVLGGRLKRLQQMYAWGDIDEADYRKQKDEVKTAMGVVAMPSIPGIEAVAAVLADLEQAWSSATPDKQAALPPLMLKAVEVEDGRVATWVVDAGLRPLLEACVVVPNPYVTIGR